jgi:lysophospholipase L1-like esterase
VAKAIHIVGLAALGAVVIVAGTVAAYSADGLPEVPTSASSVDHPTASASPSAPASPGATPADPVTFGVVGDSITAWIGKEDGSWTSYVGTDGVLFTGEGWARNGAPLALMEQNTHELDVDVLVVLGGTNDLASDSSTRARLGLVSRIVENSGVDRVVVSAVPPFDPDPALSTAWNRELEKYAAAEGYRFADSWAGSRTDTGAFVAAHTVDGIHPTPGAASRAAAVIREAVIAAEEELPLG